MDFKRQLTCCHEADYKAFAMLFVIKQKQLKKKKRIERKQMPFVLMKQF